MRAILFVLAPAVLLVPLVAQVQIVEDFDSANGSISSIPGWTSSNGSGSQTSDAVVSSFFVASSLPNHMYLWGFNSNASATLTVQSPTPITDACLSFAYEFQENANGTVEVATASSGPWTDLALPLIHDCDNLVDDFLTHDIMPVLAAIGTTTTFFIRWSSTTTLSTPCVLFGIDDVVVTVNALACPNPYSGSGEDFDLLTGIAGSSPSADPIKSAAAADTLIVSLISLGGSYDFTVPVIAGQLFVTGTIPAQLPGFGEVWLDPLPSASFPIGLLYDGTSVFFPPGLLPPGGLTLALTIPPFPTGFSIMLQGFSLWPSANTGHTFTTTDGHELQIM